jgi:hypothetical protein
VVVVVWLWRCGGGDNDVVSEIGLKMSISLHVQLPLFLSDFNETWKVLDRFSTILKHKFEENPSSGSRCVRTDRYDKANRRFPQFCEKRLRNKEHVCSV